jgi:RimJ/RimL family protein N-acetyltransferase
VAAVRPHVFADPLHGQRVTIRPIAAGDFDDVHAYMSRDDVAEYLLEPAYPLEKSQRVHPRYAEKVRFERTGDLVLLAIESEDRVVGHLDLTAGDFDGGLVEVGWRMHPDAGGRGLATEAAATLLDFAFGGLGARRATASLDPRNARSAALCERLGMRREAHHVKDRFTKGEWLDTVVYAILDEEWAARRG